MSSEPWSRVAGRAPIAYELAAGLEFVTLLRDPVFAANPARRGPLPPVLVVPGFLAPDFAMTTMVAWLRRAGFFTYVPRTGLNLRCGESAVSRLEKRLSDIVAVRGQRAMVIGHSRGGQLARVLATRHPDLVGATVTLGTPSPMDLSLTHPVIRMSTGALRALGALGVPSLLGGDCFAGECCSTFRDDLVARVDPSVELTCVVGTRDALVDRQACADPRADHVVEISASHIGTVVNAGTYRVIDAALERLTAREQRSPTPLSQPSRSRRRS